MSSATEASLAKNADLEVLVKNLAPDDRRCPWWSMRIIRTRAAIDLGQERDRILEALQNLNAGGSTNGAQGIELAYRTARENFLKGGNNRVILCTDGDFNVGVTNQSDLVDLIERENGLQACFCQCSDSVMET